MQNKLQDFAFAKDIKACSSQISALEASCSKHPRDLQALETKLTKCVTEMQGNEAKTSK